MKIDTSFSVIARCKKFRKDLDEPELTSETVDLELKFNTNTAGCVLFKFCPDFFKLNEFNCGLKYNDSHDLIGISLIDEDFIYIIKNTNQFLTEVHNGYFRLLSIDKFIDIMDFDFKAGLDFLDPPEEEKFD